MSSKLKDGLQQQLIMLSAPSLVNSSAMTIFYCEFGMPLDGDGSMMDDLLKWA